MNRRNFMAGTTAAALLRANQVRGASDRIRIALIGTGGRCTYLGSILKDLPGTEIVLACDVYEPHRLAAAEKMGPQAKPIADYREVLGRQDVDAVVIGAPDHWHARMTLDAVSARKDVYCEKPVTYRMEEGDILIGAVENSDRVVATGTQQRSWDHYLLAREIVQSGRLGGITLVQCYWYQNYFKFLASDRKRKAQPDKLDWKGWLGSAPMQPFDEMRFRRWRFFWDFGGGIFTDLMTHWIDVIQWYMNTPAPLAVQALGGIETFKEFECPDTVNAGLLFPKQYTVAYLGTLNGGLEGGGIIFRGTKATMKLTRDGFAVYPEDKIPFEGTALPEPIIQVKSSGDGTIANLQNWLDCIRSRKQPNAHIRAGVEAARTSHLANQALRTGKKVTAA